MFEDDTSYGGRGLLIKASQGFHRPQVFERYRAASLAQLVGVTPLN